MLDAASTTPVPLWFKIPEQLHEVDLAEPAEDRVRRSYANVSTVMRGSSPAERVHVVYLQEEMLTQLLSSGAVFIGHCLARSEADPSRLTSAQFSILVQEANLSASRPLHALAGALKQPGKRREVGFAEYPAGEALVVGEEVAVTLPATLTGELDENTHRVRQAQVMFAHPDNERLVIVGVSSEAVEDWHHYVKILDGIARSVAFTDPAEPTIGDLLAGL
ncbi:hypothetical protein [Saccharopolyspora dendranthemae]|uniref:hypothetical protein n=1 Tax=Saccharopolyspora dendranthemae TaxID=1181886 RepID=UPI0011AAFD0F|nr:hypothetical protein [Saccharopolyspora dendranthemae]